MARRVAPPAPQRPQLTADQLRRGIQRLQQRIEAVKNFDPAKVQKRFNCPELSALETSIEEALAAVFGNGTVEYNRYVRATRLDHGPVQMSVDPFWGGGHPPREDHQQYIREGKDEAIALLEQAIRRLEEELEDAEAEMAPSAFAPVVHSPSKVFVVHGHDEAAKQEVARFLEKLDLEAVILQEKPDQGRTIIEKYEVYAKDVGYAVVLLTPDDLAATNTTPEITLRARQNVIFELGYFAGKLGRGRVCLMLKGKVEIPSDLYGVIYTPMDSGGGWKFKLVGEMKAAGLRFDANKVFE